MSSHISTRDLHQVVSCKLGLMSPDEIKNQSVGEITNLRPYDMQSMYPTEGGVNDARMGSTNRRWNCLKCQGTAIECQGHFGHMQLAQPVYHLGFLPIIKKILNCVCFNCQKLLCDIDDEQIIKIKRIKNGSQRLNLIHRMCSTKKQCDDKPDDQRKVGCGYIQPKFSIQKLFISLNEGNNDDPNLERNLLPEQCQQIFKKISNDECFLLGFDTQNTRPENMILSVLPVAPPSIRPAIQMDSVQRAEDDLTHQYTSILKINNKMKEMINKALPASQLEKQLEQLQYFVATLMNNDINGIQKATRKSGQPIKSIRERLRGKEGRLRKNLMGKRVDFSARTVVSPDPNLALDELGVPRSIAMNLTFPETVTQLNIEKMKQLVINGPSEWPGAKSIIRNDGKQFDLRYIRNREEIQLDYGMIVERHIVDGDYVVFNRQPSLHRMSMMGHRIKILPFSSFRLNLSVTTPYNADFDGDEMNMHVPQSYESKTEIKNIMHVPKQIVSPQVNRPVMGIVQDALLGIRLFTRRNTFLTRSQVMTLIFWIDDWNGELPQPAILKPQKLWTGKQIISMILPNINLERKCNVHGDPNTSEETLFQMDGKIIIEKGQLLTGMLDKGTVGNTSGGVIHCIWLDDRPQAAATFLTSAQKIINNWLVMHGFSVGASDIFPDEECNTNVQKDLQKVQFVVPNLYQKAEQKKMDHQPGKSMLESFEANVNNELNNLFKEASQKAQASMNDRNRIYCMVAAGSKGTNMNIAQIMVCVGQQNVEGKRIPYGFHRRTLPHFSKDEFGPEARGFVKNSYLTGLKPDEFFFHAMGGREGLIDTAVKTSDTGYIQRKLIKCFEDVMVKYDSTVRDCLGNLVQFIYGEDGMAGEYIEQCNIKSILELKDTDFTREYKFFEDQNVKDISEQLSQYERFFEQNILEEIIQNPQDLDKIQNEFLKIKQFRDQIRTIVKLDFDQKFYLPVNVQRLINNVKINYKNVSPQKSKLNPIYVIDSIDKLIQNLTVIQGNDQITLEAQDNSILFMSAFIRFFLSSKKVCIKDRLTPEMFQQIIGEIQSKFDQAKVHPGEMIGIICAQSIGEPTTQMTLNTFHTAGYSAKNVTLGVPRIKEILNASANIKTPSMSIYIQVDEEQQGNYSEILKKLQSSLEFTTLGHLCIKSEIYYDPDYKNTIIDDDVDVVENYLDYPDEDDPENVSSWVLRFELDKNSLIDRSITSSQIKHKIMEYLPNKVQIIYDAKIMPEKPVIRLRLKDIAIPNDEQVDLLKGMEYRLLRQYKLKGVPNIKKVFMKKDRIKTMQEDGSINTKQEEWILETDGSNLKEILINKLVDFKRTFSNSCIEMFESLGIEAARQSIINEIKMILDVYGIYINQRHLITLSDLMTRQGEVKPVTRHGINRIVEGPFRKASFEQTVEQLFTASVFSEVQQMYGITENIMFGQLAPLGTGSFKLLLNMEEVKQAKYVPDLHCNVNEEIDLTEDTIYNNTDQMGTPNPTRTPYPTNMGDTPRNNSPSYPHGCFTPQVSIKSPTYQQNVQIQAVVQPINQKYNPYSPSYPSPGYSSKVSNSPKYFPASPGIQMNHSPQSPSYTNSSPSYSPGAQKLSPKSPSYIGQQSIQSPQYIQNIYSVSPSSPNYSGSPLSNSITPSSGSGNLTNLNSNIYSPNSPQYNLPSAQYNPKSPVYDPSIIRNEKQYQSSSEDDDENEI